MSMTSIENQVYTRVKKNFSTEIKANFPDLNFTTSDKVVSNPKFPCVYIHLSTANEIGNTFDGTVIEGGQFTFQIDVYDNESQDNCDEISAEVIRILKQMQFKVYPSPIHMNTSSAYRAVINGSRPIGKDDIL